MLACMSVGGKGLHESVGDCACAQAHAWVNACGCDNHNIGTDNCVSDTESQ